MTRVTRNQIMDALLTQLEDNMPLVKTFTRRFSEYSSLSQSAQLPYLILTRARENYPQRAITGLPPKRNLKCEIFIYLSAGQDQSAIPDETVCDIMDQVDTALRPPVGQEALTLGGIIDHCYIMGDVIQVPGDLDGTGLMIIPLEVVIP
jgi:hypothetical protein